MTEHEDLLDRLAATADRIAGGESRPDEANGGADWKAVIDNEYWAPLFGLANKCFSFGSDHPAVEGGEWLTLVKAAVGRAGLRVDELRADSRPQLVAEPGRLAESHSA